MGYANRQANEFSQVMDWRGRNMHLLGDSPPEQYAVIEKSVPRRLHCRTSPRGVEENSVSI